MNKIIAGLTKAGKEVYFSEKTMNNHNGFVGMSGTGKSLLMILQMIQSVESGMPVVTLNWKNCVRHEDIPTPFLEMYEKNAIVIDVAKDGIALPLFTLEKDAKGNEEPVEQLLQRTSAMFSVAGKLTASQETMLYEAIENIYNCDQYFVEGISQMPKMLTESGKKTGMNAANKLRSICSQNLIHDGDFWQNEPKIYEINVNGLEKEGQRVLCLFLLEYLDRKASKGAFLQKGLNLFIDECHNLDFSKNGTIDTIINEKRKEGFDIKLATTKLETSGEHNMKSMHQCAFQFYFRPDVSDIRMVAKWIDPLKMDTWIYNLNRLGRGEYIACGNFIIDGVEKSGPIILKTPIEYLAEKWTRCAEGKTGCLNT